MQCHDPQISWPDKEITKWLKLCHYSCLHLPHIVVTSTTMDSLNFPVTTVIPEVYHEFTEDFSKTDASGIPPHRSYNCAIDLLPGSTPPCNCIYPLSLTEQQTTEDYVQEALQQGYIHPSTFPASAGFFFVKKEGKVYEVALTTED